MKGKKKENSASLYITWVRSAGSERRACAAQGKAVFRVFCRKFVVVVVSARRNHLYLLSFRRPRPACLFPRQPYLPRPAFFLPLSRAFRAPTFCRTTTTGKLFGFFFFFCNSVDDVVAAINGKKRKARRAQKYLIYICRCIIFRGRQKKSVKGKIAHGSENKRNYSCGARYTSSAIVCFRVFYRGRGTRDSGTGSLHNNLVIETTYRGLDDEPFVRGRRQDKSA